jgi:hypothetical protein
LNTSLPADRPRLPEAEYEGRIIGCYQWPTYWTRKLTTWDRERGHLALQRWVAIYDVRIQRGLTKPAHDAVQQWRQEAERWPVVPLMCSYYTEPDKTAIVRLQRSSKLYKLLRAARRARRPDVTVFFIDDHVDIRLPVGLDVCVFLGLTTQASDEDPITRKTKIVKLERDADGRVIDIDAYSVVTRLISISVPQRIRATADAGSSYSVLNSQDSALGLHPSASSARLDAISRTYERGVNGAQTPIVAEASDGGINQAVGHPAGAVTAIAARATATAPDAKTAEHGDTSQFVPRPALTSAQLTAALKTRFGNRREAQRCGKCSQCGDPLWAREYEAGWCPRGCLG